jgi:hypothetical protein
MSNIRIRLTGNQDQANALATALHGLDHIERVELVADQMRGIRDDSSSNALNDDVGPDLHCIEVETSGKSAAAEVHSVVETSAMEQGVVVEFVDRF